MSTPEKQIKYDISDYATKVVISLVKSPLYSDIETKIFDNELKAHFSVPQTYKLNDYILLKSQSNIDIQIQFKIIDVEPEQFKTKEFKIDSTNTSLIQTGHHVKDKWIWNKKFDKALDSYVSSINDIVKFYKFYHETNQESLPITLLYGPSGSGKTRLVESLCALRSLHLIKANGVNLSGDSPAAVEKRIEILFQNALSHGPCVVLIKSALNSAEREVLFKSQFKDDTNDLAYFLKKTTGLLYGETKTYIDFIKYEISQNANATFLVSAEKASQKYDHNRKFKQENRLNIEAINWNDIGGLGEIKNIIMDTILLPLNYPSLFTSTNNQLGISRSGILLYGPPGTGKTLLAKAICSQCELNFLSVKGPELLDMYVGQTELNVRNLFQKARNNAPCVLFFDELDSLAPIRGRAGDSGGVMDRVVSQLLTEIDGLDKHVCSTGNKESKSNQIFLIGATNRPDLIDSSLLRPGRFDKLVYVAVAKTKQERLNILKAQTRKLKIDPSFDMEGFIEKCPLNLTGADFYSITNRSRQNALKRLINELDRLQLDIEQYNSEIVINESDFILSLESFVPTLNNSTLLDYEKYFSKYSDNK